MPHSVGTRGPALMCPASAAVPGDVIEWVFPFAVRDSLSPLATHCGISCPKLLKHLLCFEGFSLALALSIFVGVSLTLLTHTQTSTNTHKHTHTHTITDPRHIHTHTHVHPGFSCASLSLILFISPYVSFSLPPSLSLSPGVLLLDDEWCCVR